MSDLRARPAGAALALKLAVLTVTRTSEVLNAKQGEFDLNAGLWTIPAARMEARREHRVALSKPALATVSELAKTRIAEFVFPGQKLGRPLSNMAMLMLLEPMGKAKGDNLARGSDRRFRIRLRKSARSRRSFAKALLRIR
jgi:integrase